MAGEEAGMDSKPVNVQEVKEQLAEMSRLKTQYLKASLALREAGTAFPNAIDTLEVQAGDYAERERLYRGILEKNGIDVPQTRPDNV
jgi:hypothetical protein